ncbi:TetR/AcrR family transcriptional regulator [Nonomuraea typhae]|uniref:TetR/AcrR family transcriptional regulator n=1 Tax=Nonomuraea typhae TaxID=2603600 RepID=UPI001CA4C7B4|nr:TetR/AcrR family transcriptional regulator [Nonomuraea typhae]
MRVIDALLERALSVTGLSVALSARRPTGCPSAARRRQFHFPTQRALQDEVLTRLYDVVVSDERIHDRGVPARDRLVDCLRQVLAPAGVGAGARQAHRTIHEQFIAPEPTEQVREAYFALEREGRRRVEYWLTVLTQEGALAPGDTSRRAKFLLTVLNGLALERALPSEGSILQSENDTLYMAVDAVLNPATS